MSIHALEVLEFERVLERVARRAASESGRISVLSLRPKTDPDAVLSELRRVAATMRFLHDEPNWGPGPIPEIESDLAQLRVEGSVLEPLGVHRIGVLLTSSRLLAVELDARGSRYPELGTLTDALLDRRDLEQAVTRSVDADGQVLGTASKELKRIRDRLRGAHGRVVRTLEAYMRTLADRLVVADASVTIRDGRYVIPVRREGKSEVGGIVHDESQTGATLYVEPPVAIELMNQLRDLEREEAREIRRILGELTRTLAPEHAAIEGALRALVDFDTLLARAKTARAWEAAVPEIDARPDTELRIRAGRHPLLVESSDETVVPFDLDLSHGERCVIVSGPNTGGKSVFLKALGLISTLAQSGVVPPIGEGTRLPVFMSFFADIGDEQSIARSLSTFSAHLANLADLVTEADDRSLVLIDEIGTGTDPAEGAALARALIDTLVESGATTFVSSHFGELKRLDAEGSGVVNASLQFDPDRMEPTYRFLKGRPGRSYGLAIARALGFPASLLDRAERYRGEEAADMEEVLARLEAQERRVEVLAHELDLERARTERLKQEVEARESKVSEAERTAAERARKQTRTLLLEARAEVEEAIEELRDAAARGEALDTAARAARRRVELAAGLQAAALDQDGEPPPPTGDLALDDEVRIHATGARGRVVELRAGRALVETGSLRLEVPVNELRRAEARQEEPGRKSGGWSGPSRGQARTEVDLRGLRVDEMEIELERALDLAIMEELGQLRIIHGKGTGALRKRVSEILAVDTRVSDFRTGAPGEGGTGVTVAVLAVGE